MKSHDLSGQRFNRLIAQQKCDPPKEYSKSDRNTWWVCLCDCGKTKPVRATHLKEHRIKSCGCLKKDNNSKKATTHGGTGTPTWNSWRGAIDRCRRENSIGWKNYGGKGIRVCQRWQGKNGFANFLQDMGQRPENCTLDRIDSNKNYCPENCRWETTTAQRLNTTRTHWITYENETLCLSDWAKKLNKSRERIRRKLNNGWTMEQIINNSKICA